MKRLSDEFCNDDINHHTYGDQLRQLDDNGQFSPLKELIKEIRTMDLLRTLRYYGHDFKNTSLEKIQDELMARAEK